MSKDRSRWRICSICGSEFEVGERRKYCSRECMKQANSQLTYKRTKARRERGEEEKKKQRKKKAVYKKSKQYQNELARVAVAAREHGMTYGQYVGVYEYQKGMRI